MTEVIIAMLIIVVISAVSIGLVRGYSNSSDRMMGINSATSLCSNVRELFLYADSKEEFEKLPLDRQAQLIAAEQGFLEIAKVTFVIRKGPASFGGLG